LHANDILIGTASAKLGNSKYDQETVVAAMQYLKNEYFKAIGSPMRYENGKLIFLAPHKGISMDKRADLQLLIDKKSQFLICPKNAAKDICIILTAS
jgi:hypothetical protein